MKCNLYTWKVAGSRNTYLGKYIIFANKEYFMAKYVYNKRELRKLGFMEPSIYSPSECLNREKAPESIVQEIFLLAI
jgi:hypothetical protein